MTCTDTWQQKDDDWTAVCSCMWSTPPLSSSCHWVAHEQACHDKLALTTSAHTHTHRHTQTHTHESRWCGSCWHMKCHSAYCCSLPPRASHSLPIHLHLPLHHCLATLPSYYTYLLSVPLTFTLSNHSHCSQFPSEWLHITHPITCVLLITGPCQRSRSH